MKREHKDAINEKLLSRRNETINEDREFLRGSYFGYKLREVFGQQAAIEYPIGSTKSGVSKALKRRKIFIRGAKCGYSFGLVEMGELIGQFMQAQDEIRSLKALLDSCWHAGYQSGVADGSGYGSPTTFEDFKTTHFISDKSPG